MKHFSSLFAINMFISSFYSLFNKFSTFSFINCAFIIGMIYFLFGCVCFVWQKGFFNITLFAFNKISNNFQRRRGTISDNCQVTIDDYIYRENNFFLTNSLLYCGLFISISTTVISFVIIS